MNTNRRVSGSNPSITVRVAAVGWVSSRTVKHRTHKHFYTRSNLWTGAKVFTATRWQRGTRSSRRPVHPVSFPAPPPNICLFNDHKRHLLLCFVTFFVENSLVTFFQIIPCNVPLKCLKCHQLKRPVMFETSWELAADYQLTLEHFQEIVVSIFSA